MLVLILYGIYLIIDWLVDVYVEVIMCWVESSLYWMKSKVFIVFRNLK